MSAAAAAAAVPDKCQDYDGNFKFNVRARASYTCTSILTDRIECSDKEGVLADGTELGSVTELCPISCKHDDCTEYFPSLWSSCVDSVDRIRSNTHTRHTFTCDEITPEECGTIRSDGVAVADYCPITCDLDRCKGDNNEKNENEAEKLDEILDEIEKDEDTLEEKEKELEDLISQIDDDEILEVDDDEIFADDDDDEILDYYYDYESANDEDTIEVDDDEVINMLLNGEAETPDDYVDEYADEDEEDEEFADEIFDVDPNTIIKSDGNVPTFQPTADFPTYTPTKLNNDVPTVKDEDAFLPPKAVEDGQPPEPTKVEDIPPPKVEDASPLFPEKNSNSNKMKGSILSAGHSIGFQSNWGDESSYSGSMVYDFQKHTVYLTGTTYKSDRSQSGEKLPQRSSCFVGQIPIADIQNWKVDDPPLPPRGDPEDFVVPDSFFGTEQMGCHTILYDSDSDAKMGADYLYVGGVDENTMNDRSGDISAFVNLYQRGNNGMINPTSVDWTNKQKGSSSLVPDTKDDSGEGTKMIKYPIAMEYGSRYTDKAVEIAVLNVASYDSLLTDAYIENGDKENIGINHKNSLLPPGLGSKSDPLHKDYYKRGSAFFFTLQMFTLKDDCDRKNRCNKVIDWTEPNGEYVMNEQLDPSSTDTNILPTGLINFGGLTGGRDYVVVGSYKGQTGFNNNNKKLWTATSEDNDYDGFVQTFRFPKGKATWYPIRKFESIETTPKHLNDYVHDVCKGYDKKTGDVDSYYVVGSTYGTMPKGTLQATTGELDQKIMLPKGKLATKEYKPPSRKKLSSWVSKINVSETNDGEVLWTTQLYGTDHAEAFGCHVIPSEPSIMYVGGTVYDGGEMMYVRSGLDSVTRKGKSRGNSLGKDDVWVAQLNTNDGSLKWIKQIGSSGNDRISRTNGVSADLDGDCIIYGETDGELYRSKKDDIDPSHTDIFLVKLDKADGTYVSTLEMDREKEKQINKQHATIGSIGGILVFLSLCMCGCIFYKWHRPQRRRQRKTIEDVENADGIFSDDPRLRDGNNKDDDDDRMEVIDDVMEMNGNGNGYHDDPENNTASNKMSNGGNYKDDTASKRIQEEVTALSIDAGAATTNGGDSSGDGENNTDGDAAERPIPDQSAFKDDPDYRPGRNFV